MNETQLEKNIAEAISPVIEETGHRLVCVDMGQEGSMPLLRVMCEDPKTRRINVDACANISREISAILDVEDFVPYHYRLEVSSPGIDRPLMAAAEFLEFIGHDVRLGFAMPMENGQKKIRGNITSVEGNVITIESDGKAFEIDYERISKAKLVLTDELIKETAKLFEVSVK